MARAFLSKVFALLALAAATIFAPTALAQASDSQPVYVLGSGDQISVTVFDEPSLSGQFQIDGTGAVSLPLIGQVQAGGLTVPQFEDAIETALLDGYLNHPRVNVQVLNYRPYYILGEVQTAGEYPYTDGLTVLNAVATAGGFTYRARQNVVFIKRVGDEDFEQVRLSASTLVQPGDTIRIAERFF